MNSYNNFVLGLGLMLLLCFKNSWSQNTSSRIESVIAFGDSILDTGNNNLLLTATKCNFIPYGRDMNGGAPTGRFGNGKVLSDLITSGLQIKALLPAYRTLNLPTTELPTGVCFASGGSGMDQVTARMQGVLWIEDQLNDFKDYINKLNVLTGNRTKTQNILGKTLFLLSAGNNDLSISFFSTRVRGFYTIDAYTDLLVQWSEGFLKTIYDLGARKFGVFGTLPLGCLPGARDGTGLGNCIGLVNQAAQLFNEKLQKLVVKLNTVLPGSDFHFIDVYTYLNDIIKNPQAYGFVDAVFPCIGAITCPNAATNVFWDIAHPTQKAYEIIVAQILKDHRYFTSF